MRCGIALRSLALTTGLLTAALPLFSQQAPDTFRWIDFHAQKDQDVVTWVTRSLTVEDWTAIREIAVEYDAALVVTTRRANPQAAATDDSFNVWSVSPQVRIFGPGMQRTPTSVFRSLTPDPGPQAAVATFFGLPPIRPFALEAFAFAALRALPPSSPRRVAIHRFEPKNPSNSAGMYTSASNAGK